MSTWLGGIISKLSPRKSRSLSNLFEDGGEGPSAPVVENIEPHHRTTDYLETRETRVTRSVKVRRRKSSKVQDHSPVKRRLSTLLLREKSPARRFLATGLDLLTRSSTQSPPVSSPDLSESDSNHATGSKSASDSESSQVLQHEECREEEVDPESVDTESIRKRLFGEEEPDLNHLETQQSNSSVNNTNVNDNSVEELVMETSKLRTRQARSCSPKRKLRSFHFEIKQRKRGPDFNVTEEREIVEYFKTRGGFKFCGGNTVWRRMEEAGVCRPRTWQSLKQRFQAFIKHDLEHFLVSEEELLAVDLVDQEERNRADNSKPESLNRGTSVDKNYAINANIIDNGDLSHSLLESEENVRPASELLFPESLPVEQMKDVESDPDNHTNSSKSVSTMPEGPVYQCQVLADRQAQIIEELRQLDRGVGLGKLAPPGTNKKPTEQRAPVTSKLSVVLSKSNELPPKTKPSPAICTDSSDPYKVKRRTPYSFQEEQEIINYLLRYGGFLSHGGNTMWRRMEESALVCQGRTWQSLKQRFNKVTLKHLHLFGIKKRDLIEGGGERAGNVPLAVFQPPEDAGPIYRKRGPPYSREEERGIIRYLLRKGGFQDRRGNLVWRKMEEARVCPGRTWQSIKQRFNAFILENLAVFDVTVEALANAPDFDTVFGFDKEPEKEKTIDLDKVKEKEDVSKSKFRRPYSAGEEEEVVVYLLKKGGFSQRGGTKLWKTMEEDRVAAGRSWQSLKARYFKAIHNRLADFGTSERAMLETESRLSGNNSDDTTSEDILDKRSNERVDEMDNSRLCRVLVPVEHWDLAPSDSELMDCIFGVEVPLDIQMCEVRDEVNPQAAEVQVDGSLSELDLLSMALNSHDEASEMTGLSRMTLPYEEQSLESQAILSENLQEEILSSNENISLESRIDERTFLEARRGGRRSPHRMKLPYEEIILEPDACMKEIFNYESSKKRKAISQNLPLSPPKKKRKYE